MRLLCLQWKVIYNKQQSSSTGVVEMYRPIYYITCFTPVGVAAAYLKIPKMATPLLSTRITEGPQQLSPDFLPDHSGWDSVPGTPSHFPDCRPSQLRFFLEAFAPFFYDCSPAKYTGSIAVQRLKVKKFWCLSWCQARLCTCSYSFQQYCASHLLTVLASCCIFDPGKFLQS